MNLNLDVDILPRDATVGEPHTAVVRGELSDDSVFILAWGTGGDSTHPQPALYLHIDGAVLRLDPNEFIEQCIRALGAVGPWVALEREATDAVLSNFYRNDIYEVQHGYDGAGRDEIRFRRIDGSDAFERSHAEHILAELLPSSNVILDGVTFEDGWVLLSYQTTVPATAD